ncbi:MAG: aspartate--tRNA(Asn) ligase [Thermoplasmata archaeon]|nr:aspartate--tRNA(Asn) ligase [Thermoplasmata archaeon]MCI4361579.1 aspartate--tRNA(Asn) ligase [Thermoplasmata archaeon]
MASQRRLARELRTLDGVTVRIAGHLEDYRALGGVAFALVRDGTGTTQVTLKKGVADPALFDLFQAASRESVVEVEGVAKRSEKSNRGVELFPTSARVLSIAEVPLPLGVVDKVGADLDTRLNHRVLDLRKPANRAIFELRGAVLEGFRIAFRDLGFIEVETPKILRQGAEGGATLFPIDYFGERAYLAQSPQLYKQMLMAAGFERVVEIGPVFRAEPSDTVRHITEIAMLDGEMAFIESAEDLRVTLEEAVARTIAHARTRLTETGNPLVARLADPPRPFPRLPFSTVVEWLGRPGTDQDMGTEDERKLGELVQQKLGVPLYFITDFPTSTKATTFYARRQDDRPELTEYFDLDFSGLEIASGGPREHRLDRLTANILSAGLDPASFPGYLEAFRYGMPPHGGWGFGIDRFTQALTGVPNIREVRLFPRDRYRLEP